MDKLQPSDAEIQHISAIIPCCEIILFQVFDFITMADRSLLLYYLFMNDMHTGASLLCLLSFFIVSTKHKVTRNPTSIIYFAQYAILQKYFYFYGISKINKYNSITMVENQTS